MALALSGVGNRKLTGYSVQEDATPLDVSSTEGGVGAITFGIPQDENSVMLFDTALELDDDFRGTTSGTITKVELAAGIASITADSRLGVLVGPAKAHPKTGTFEAVARYYLSLGSITDSIYFDPAIANIPVTAQGWNTDAWLNLKQLAQANGVEIALVSNKIVFRPVRSLLTSLPRRLTNFTESIEKGDIARAVEITYYDNVWTEGTLIYPRTLTEFSGQQIYSVEAGQVLEDDITLSVSLESVLQPVCVDDVAQDYNGEQSVYTVRANDNSLVTPQMWTSGGGNVELTINDDSTSVHIKITASNDESLGPYRLAGRIKEVADPAAVIDAINAGTAAGSDPVSAPATTKTGDYRYADVSRWQGAINWASFTLPGAMIKLGGSDSGTYTDANYLTNVAGARTYGKHIGHYWFNGAGDPAADANYFVGALSQYRTEDFLILDVESGGTGTPWTPAKVLTFFQTVKASKTSARMMVYMSEATTDAYDWTSVVNYGVKLWVANWGSNSGSLPSTKPTPSHWSSYTLWQYTSVGHTGGVSGNVDLSFSSVDLFPSSGTPAPTTVTNYPAAVDDYPWKTSQINTLSPLRYDYRECVDFVAWRINRDAGVKKAPWKWTWSNLRVTNGDAIGWKHDWELHGWKTNITPVPGAIAWWGTTAGTYGHVAYVQAVTGSNVVLEEYNWGGNHTYHTRTVPISSVPSFLASPAGPTGTTTTIAVTTGTASVAPTTTTAAIGSTPVSVEDTSQSEQDYASLRIIGTGTLINPQILSLPTSAAADRTATDVGVTAQNIYVASLEDAYRVGVYVTSRYRGEDHTISGTVTQINQRSGTGSILYPTVEQFNRTNGGKTIADFDNDWRGKTIGQFNEAQKATVHDTFDNQVFGNVAGARFKYNNAYWRVTATTITQDGIDFTATRDTMIEDFNVAHAGRTIADFNAQYAGLTMKQFGRIPLLGG